MSGPIIFVDYSFAENKLIFLNGLKKTAGAHRNFLPFFNSSMRKLLIQISAQFVETVTWRPVLHESHVLSKV